MILNTRPARYQDAFAKNFDGFGHEVIACPMLSIEATNAQFPASDAFDTVLLTSQISIEMFPADKAWRTKQVLAVGNATAIAALEAGFTDITCTGENAADMMHALERTSFKRALFPSGQHVATDLAAALPDKVTRVVAYQAIATPFLRSSLVHRLQAGEIAYVPLFSPRAARAFCEALQNENVTNARIIAIAMSPNVAAVLPPAWGAIIAPHMTAEAMAETLAHIVGIWPAAA
jgi:uroporphyrinogen-III synthase